MGSSDPYGKIPVLISLVTTNANISPSQLTACYAYKVKSTGNYYGPYAAKKVLMWIRGLCNGWA